MGEGKQLGKLRWSMTNPRQGDASPHGPGSLKKSKQFTNSHEFSTVQWEVLLVLPCSHIIPVQAQQLARRQMQPLLLGYTVLVYPGPYTTLLSLVPMLFS